LYNIFGSLKKLALLVPLDKGLPFCDWLISMPNLTILYFPVIGQTGFSAYPSLRLVDSPGCLGYPLL
jgi:hypothetical protein